MDDELFQVKNYFYLGNYQKAVNEASQGFSEGCKTELDCLIYRSYVGMGNHGDNRVLDSGAERPGDMSDAHTIDIEIVRVDDHVALFADEEIATGEPSRVRLRAGRGEE